MTDHTPTKDKTGGPAFPESTHPDGPYGGMTLRDYFAAKAMAGLLPSSDAGYPAPKAQDNAEVIAAHAYEYADAMLAQREKEAQ